jgi:hypothetical protein
MLERKRYPRTCVITATKVIPSRPSHMLEQRWVFRTRVLKAAKVIAIYPTCIYDCLVRDISSLGARLEFSSTAAVPDTFELTFDSGRTLRDCHVAWRTKTQVGVKFSNLLPA